MGDDLFGIIDEIGEFSQGFSTKDRSGNSNEVTPHAFPSILIFVVIRCHLGGMMYDLWESLLLESELESQVIISLFIFEVSIAMSFIFSH